VADIRSVNDPFLIDLGSNWTNTDITTTINTSQWANSRITTATITTTNQSSTTTTGVIKYYTTIESSAAR